MQASQQLNEHKIVYRASFRQRLSAGLVFVTFSALFGLLWSAAHYKVALWPQPCGFKQERGLPCPTCGMTTSALAFAQGRIFESFYIQPAAALLCSIMVVSAFLAFLVAVFGIYFRFVKRFFVEVKIRYIILALIVILAASWAATLARALKGV